MTCEADRNQWEGFLGSLVSFPLPVINCAWWEQLRNIDSLGSVNLLPSNLQSASYSSCGNWLGYLWPEEGSYEYHLVSHLHYVLAVAIILEIFFYTANGYFIGLMKQQVTTATTANSGVCLALMDVSNGADIIPLLFTSIRGQCKSTVYLKQSRCFFSFLTWAIFVQKCRQEARRLICSITFLTELRAALCERACGLVLFHSIADIEFPNRSLPSFTRWLFL